MSDVRCAETRDHGTLADFYRRIFEEENRKMDKKMPSDRQSTQRLANGGVVGKSTGPITPTLSKPSKRPHPSATPPAVKLAVVGMVASIAPFTSQAAHAATYTWNTTTSGALWSAAGSWNPAAVPTFAAGDTFDLSTLNIGAATTSTMDTVGGNTLGTIKIGDTNNPHSWTLGLSTALTLDGNGSAATINQISTSKGDTINGAGGIVLASDLNITNASGNILQLSTGITSTGGTRTITNNGSGFGRVNLNNAIGSGINLVQNSTTSALWMLGASSSFNGTITVKAGNFEVGATGANGIGLGTAAFTLGDTSGSSDATIFFKSGNGSGYAAPINVASGSSGIKSIFGAVTSGNNSYFLNSAITLGASSSATADVTIGNSTGSTSTYNVQGGITGFGNVTVKTTSSGKTRFATTSINNTGTLTNVGTGTGVAQIDAVVGANVTGIVQNSTTSAMNLGTANTSFAGSVTVTAGTLNLGNASALNANNVVSVASGATFNLADNSNTIAGLNTGTGTVTNTSGNNKALTIGGSGTYSFGGKLTATTLANFNLVMNGTGTQTLSGSTNDYAGGTSLINGMLILGDKSALGTGTINFNSTTAATAPVLQANTDLSGANKLANALTVSNTQGSATIGGSNNLEIGGVTTLASGASRTLTINNSATTTFSGNTFLTNTDTSGRTATINGSGNATISGVIDDNAPGTNTNAAGLTYGGSGTLTLSNAANTYAGVTTVAGGGKLSVGTLANGLAASSIGNSSNAAASLVLNGGTLQYTGAAVSTNRLFSLQSSSTIDASGAANAALNFTNTGSMGFNSGTAAKTLTLTGSSTGANTIAAVIGDNTGATSVAKSGAGTWVLSGVNSYTGITTVQAGTLALDAAGSIANSAVIDVQDTAIFNVSAVSGFAIGAAQTLKGNGTVIAPATTSGVTVIGIVSPGASIGDLDVTGNATLVGTTAMEIGNISGTLDWDEFNASAALALGGTLNVTYSATHNTALVLNDSFDLFDGTLSSSFATTTLPSLNPGLSWDTTQLSAGGTGSITVVPEPGICVTLLGMGSAGLLMRRRRKAEFMIGN